MIWARVQVALGEKVEAEVPEVTPFFTAHWTGAEYQASAATSAKLLAVSAAGALWAFHRKVTIWARVQGASGEKVEAEVPEVMPFSTAHSTAVSYQLPAFTSEKEWAVLLGAGEPAAFHRKVTAWARVQEALGPKVLAVRPEVMFLSTAQATGAAK